MAENEWVVVELGQKAEGEDPDLVRASIRHVIRGAEVFIPASVIQLGEDRVIEYLVDGYAFIRHAHADLVYSRLENTKYVQAVLKKVGNGPNGKLVKQLATVTDSHIEKLRRQIKTQVDQGIGVGDLVEITSGAYRKIQCRVVEELPENDMVCVHIELRSKQAILPLQRGCLRLVQKAERSPLHGRVAALREWLQPARAFVSWPVDNGPQLRARSEQYVKLRGWFTRVQERVNFKQALEAVFDVERLQRASENFERISRWVSRSGALFRGVHAMRTPPLDAPELVGKLREWERLSHWTSKMKALYSVINPAYNPPPSSSLEVQFLDYVWLQDVMQRLGGIEAEVEAMEMLLETGSCMAENVIIDGTQLAIRCALTPGLSTLKDGQGRPTGAITGFLNSLGSLKKKFPGATFYVTWDGSSQRRRKMYDGYKANRSERSPLATFEIQYLKDTLAFLGVHQAYNPEEEADDVIATLVRGPLKGQQNVFVSTNRDLIQLVTKTDFQFVPAVGAGKEKVYGVAEVESEYGVPPHVVVRVRAVSGDTSDNIPGVPGFGLKTAAKLVKLYDSIDQLFASNLAGPSPKMLEALRASEKQVKLNAKLLQLCDDLPLTLLGPDVNQTAASQRLQDVNIRPDPILKTFF